MRLQILLRGGHKRISLWWYSTRVAEAFTRKRQRFFLCPEYDVKGVQLVV